MGIFVCGNCKCKENTALTGNTIKWIKKDGNTIKPDNGFPNLGLMEMQTVNSSSVSKINDRISPIGELEEHMLCSECNGGTWHGEFEKKLATDEELKIAGDNLYNMCNGALTSKISVLNKIDREAKRWSKDTNNGEYSDPYPNGTNSDWFGGPSTRIRLKPKINRNDICPCGSGKKYKKCCLNKDV